MLFPRVSLFALTAAFLALMSCTVTTRSVDAQQPPLASVAPLTALVSRSGQITIRRADSDRVVATVTPGLFEKTWQYRSVSDTGKAAGEAERGATITAGVIRASSAGAAVAVQGRVEADGNRLRLRYELTPDKDAAVNSAHVSVNVPVQHLIGGTWVSGLQPKQDPKVIRIDDRGVTFGTIPSAARDNRLFAADAPAPDDERQLSLNNQSKIYARIVADVPMLLQDNRVFGGGELEVRLGQQSGEGRTFAAGKTETIAFTLELPGAVTVQREEPITLAAGPDWIPLDLKLDIAPGSALDFSFLNDGPAGRYGRVIVRPDGHFGFEKGPSRPVRFYGVNLAFSANYPDKALADRMAERFRRIGYNTVRIHHHEGELIAQNAPDSLTLRADSFDKLDYLVAALKKRGIYLKTDLFVSRPVKQTELDTEAGMDNFKAALLVSDKAMDNWKAFSRKFLTHVNPYTGLAYKDDPALAWLSVVNESNATNYLGRIEGKLRARFQQEWENWLKTRYATNEKLRAAWADPAGSLTFALPKSIEKNARGRDVAAFLTILHERAYRTMRAFLRNEIGTKALLTDLNGWSETPAFMAARTQLDWVDNHFYWDHPQFLEREWNLPSQGGSGGRGAVESGGAGPSGLAMTRLFGKPFSVSEYNYSSPNPYRAEGGLITGAAAALQDWDAVWRFAYSHSRDAVDQPRPLNYFDMAVDPAGQASERAALLLFLRGDARPASGSVALVRSRADLMDQTKETGGGFGDLSLVTQVGTRVTELRQATPPPAWGKEIRLTDGASAEALAALRQKKVIPTANRTNLESGIRESETDEIWVDSEHGLLRIHTPRTVGGVAPSGQTITAGPLSAKVTGTRAAVWASSLDNQPVTKARRLLLVHLTDVQNTGMRYAASDRRVLQDWGGLPHLARTGGAQVRLTHDRARQLRAWRLDTSGKRVAPIPVRVEGKNRAVLDLSTRAQNNSATLYYEIEG